VIVRLHLEREVHGVVQRRGPVPAKGLERGSNDRHVARHRDARVDVMGKADERRPIVSAQRRSKSVPSLDEMREPISRNAIARVEDQRDACSV
jgi:hypothetical protein